MFSDVFEDKKENLIELGPNGMSIDLLRAVYRNPAIPLPVRIRAAVAALPHEVPRLAVTALVNEQSFAELLDRRLARIDAMNGKAIEQTNGNDHSHPIDPPMAPITAEPPKPMPRTVDRRFRRM